MVNKMITCISDRLCDSRELTDNNIAPFMKVSKNGVYLLVNVKIQRVFGLIAIFQCMMCAQQMGCLMEP